MQTKLPINGTIQHPDLAEALRGESGTFFCQQGGQGYIVTAAEGFSIKSLRPVGRTIMEANVVLQGTPEPWAIAKISGEELFAVTLPDSSCGSFVATSPRSDPKPDLFVELRGLLQEVRT